MKKYLILFATFTTSFFMFGQVVIKNAENFVEGIILTFQNCENENVNVGEPGKKQTWDFSTLKIKKNDLTIEEMIAPELTNMASNFPDANLVERYSDGRLVFMNKTENENYLLGFVDTNTNIVMKYTKPMLFAKRPLKYKDHFDSDFETAYTIKGMDFTSKGNVSIVADGCGTLILPNGKFENVLRVKITQTQIVVLTQYNSQSTTETVSYVWFDDNHTSALLKIDETKSTYYNDTLVQFLLSEKMNEKE